MNRESGVYEELKAEFRLRDVTAPLLYMVHGRAGNIEVMWAFRRTVPDEFSLLSVEAPQHDPAGGYSWWQVEPVPDGIDAAVAASGRFLDFCDAFESAHNLTPSVRLVIGFSQGAVLSSLAMQRRPDFFHGVGLLAGFVAQHPEVSSFVESLVKPEVFIAHGSKDETISIARAQAGFQLLESWGVEVDFYEDPVGHKVGSSGMRALKEWLFSFA